MVLIENVNQEKLIKKEVSFVVKKAHEIIRKIENKVNALDCTCGNGHDTLFLVEIFQNVFAFDIQELAIKRSKKRLEGYNVNFFLDNFINIDKYNLNNIDLIIYNLGFLPGSNKKIITKKEDTILSIEKAINLLSEQGKILITVYLRHEGGLEEYETILEYLSGNPQIKKEIFSDNLTSDALIVVTKINFV